MPFSLLVFVFMLHNQNMAWFRYYYKKQHLHKGINFDAIISKNVGNEGSIAPKALQHFLHMSVATVQNDNTTD